MPLGTEVGLGPGHIVLDGDPAPPRNGVLQPPPLTFRPMSIVTKRSPISATAELLSETVSVKITIIVRNSVNITDIKHLYLCALGRYTDDNACNYW